ncbi:hypothetical protein GJ689_21325 [Rhodoplanes serenus]|jgi:hypothetical protein|uniref:Uncharacterized protein n=1 Tax=Rhodoplanes serenus TaxID=200615 RepID=A0A327JSX1_9BRAD|nr:hypothetical protein [Rhodoplanes serenus]MBI5112406.1 hypothetical protein [Rhodovulum sp.]MTW18747.1 hypothetical protein [Rhodoplanes serenus]RAI28725.1 hypothetical protein CH340_23390 [Rhodoplanes serenus]VCU09262.1 hypothetical protein RHODGE_RHODGE_02436 [Rhodoplanes serenus]
MANASKKHFGPGVQGKGDGTGGTTDIVPEQIPENGVLSNRDKARHPEGRGLDGKFVQSEQFRDHSMDRQIDD